MDAEYSADDPTFASSHSLNTQPEQKTAPDAEPTQARTALVKEMLDRVKRAKKKWDKAFKRMRADMKFAAGQHDKHQKDGDDTLQVDVVQRHIQSRMSALYAKNPTVLAKRRERLNFAIWDGEPQSFLSLQQRVQQAARMGMPPAPNDMALMQDILQGVQEQKMYERVGKTLTLAYNYALDEQQPPFKTQLKQLVVRVITTGVGYVETGYQRALQRSPENQMALDDATMKVATLMRLQQEITDGDLDTYQADIERYNMIKQSVESDPDMVVREGLVYNFLASTRVIPDENCKMLEGFLGCNEVSVEYALTSDEIMETWEVDVSGAAKSYTEKADGQITESLAMGDKQEPKYCVYKVYSKRDGLVYVVCDGYKDFLTEPAEPEIYIEGFWPIEALTFNKQESENNPFPRSDVRLLTPLQKELNRTQSGLREHRIASRPLYIAAPGMFSEEEKQNLAEHDAHSVLELQNADKPVDQLIQLLKKAAIDPNLYTADPIYTAIQKVMGSDDTSNGKSATGDSIDEAKRISSLSSNTDDLDDLLTALTKKGSGVLLREMSVQTIQRIVGRGAVWPEFSAQEVAEQLWLEIKAASSGRPNRAQDLANAEKVMPFLLQIPGIPAQSIVQWLLNIVDDRINLADFYTEGLPSIVSQNSMKQIGTGNPATDPNAQGPQGGQNAPNFDESAGGPQPAYPTGAPGPSAPAPALAYQGSLPSS